MTKQNEKPCEKCGTFALLPDGRCRECRRVYNRKLIESKRIDKTNVVCDVCGNSDWFKNGRCKPCSYREQGEKRKNIVCPHCGTSEKYHNGQCKQCARNRAKEYRKNNPKKVKRMKMEWAKNNNEKILRSKRKYQRKNKDVLVDKNRLWRQENPGKVREYNHRRRNAIDPNECFTADEWRKLCEQYNHRCLCCGKKRKLTVDHVIPVSIGGSSDISNIQPLCQSCNSSKGVQIIDYR